MTIEGARLRDASCREGIEIIVFYDARRGRDLTRASNARARLGEARRYSANIKVFSISRTSDADKSPAKVKGDCVDAYKEGNRFPSCVYSVAFVPPRWKSKSDFTDDSRSLKRRRSPSTPETFEKRSIANDFYILYILSKN